MSEVAARNSTNTLVIVLAVAVVVLAAVLGYTIWSNANSVPDVTGSPAAGLSATTGGGTAVDRSTGMGAADQAGAPGAPAAPGGDQAAFDAKTATQVPKGTEPLAFVKAYHESLLKGDYEAAYKMLPADKQQSYGDAASYGEQVKAYGITSYELGEPTESGDTWTIQATQVTPQMPITYTWTLKKVGDQWYVASRSMAGQ